MIGSDDEALAVSDEELAPAPEAGFGAREVGGVILALAMSGDDLVGLIMTVPDPRLSGLRLDRPGEAVVSAAGWVQFALFGVLVAISTPLLGMYMYRVLHPEGARGPLLRPGREVHLPGVRDRPRGRAALERLRHLAAGCSAWWLLLIYALLRLQGHLPLNPDHMTSGRAGAVVQHRGQLRDQHQLAGLRRRVDHEPAVARCWPWSCSSSCRRRSAWPWRWPSSAASSAGARRTLGNFWVDMIRSTTRILLPISFVFAIVFMCQGVIQNFHAAKQVTTVAAQATHQATIIALHQTVTQGPVGSQMPIEELGDNGGGFFNANTAHPYENPNPLHQHPAVVAGGDGPLRLRRSPSASGSGR